MFYRRHHRRRLRRRRRQCEYRDIFNGTSSRARPSFLWLVANVNVETFTCANLRFHNFYNMITCAIKVCMMDHIFILYRGY